MGFISQYVQQSAKSSTSLSEIRERYKDPLVRDREQSRHIWRELFGHASENREEAYKQPRVRSDGRGGSFAGSAISEASFKRLLESMRSRAPGGWSDDRGEQTRHYTGIQFVCVHRAGELLSEAEFKVYEKDDRHPDGKRPISKFHPGYKLCEVLEKPNNVDTFGDLMAMWWQQMNLTGKALTWMVPNVMGIPMEFYSIPTAIAIPQPCINPDYPDGFYRIQPIYPYGPFSSYPTPSTAVGAPIPAQWMMEFKFPHPLLRYDGYSPLSALRQHIDVVEAMDRSRWYKMKRSSNPDAVLNFKEMEGAQPLPEPEIRRIHAEWENEYQGPENHGKLIVGTPGAELEPWGATSPKDMDYKEGWDQLVSFVMAGFGITKPAAGMVEDSSYSTLFATLKQLHLLTLNPFCHRIGTKLTRQMGHFFGDDLIVEVKCKRIDDHDIVFSKIDKAVAAKAITKNQVLKLLDLPVTKEEWGEEIAGTDSQEQQQQMGGAQPPNPMEAMQGIQQPQQQNGAPPVPGANDESAQAEPQEVSQSRPTPGNLGRGALGPRKNLNGHTKTLGGRNGVIASANGHPVPTQVVTKTEQGFTIAPVINITTPQPINNVNISMPKQERAINNVNVNVPKQDPPRITIENKPVIKVKPTPFAFRNIIPEGKRPVVNVSLPQQKAPTVNVHVPQQSSPTIEVNVPRQEAPTVNISTPEQKPPTIHVNVPQQETIVPVVNVNVPEQKTPQVDVHVPKPRRTKKTVSYDLGGRPETIVEEEID